MRAITPFLAILASAYASLTAPAATLVYVLTFKGEELSERTGAPVLLKEKGGFLMVDSDGASPASALIHWRESGKSYFQILPPERLGLSWSQAGNMMRLISGTATAIESRRAEISASGRLGALSLRTPSGEVTISGVPRDAKGRAVWRDAKAVGSADVAYKLDEALTRTANDGSVDFAPHGGLLRWLAATRLANHSEYKD